MDKNNAEGTSWKITKIDDPRAHITTANVRHMRPYHDPTTPWRGKQCNTRQVQFLLRTRSNLTIRCNFQLVPYKEEASNIKTV